ncbi:hypothetical protein ES708_00309 [subsurface metagenome]
MKITKVFYLTMTLLMTAMLLLPASCSRETEVPTSESNRWLELLRVLPENENTIKAAYLSDWAYSAEKMPEAEYAVGHSIPLFQRVVPIGPGGELKENLGFSGDEITSVIYAGALPVNYYQAVRGDFNREDVDNAAKTGPMNEKLELEVITYKGHDFYSWGEDFEINLAMRSNIRPLGRGHRLALVDDFIFWVLWTDGIKEMIDSYEGNIPSLADNEDYWLLAGALEELDTVTAFFSAESQSQSHIKEVYKGMLEEPSNERQQLFTEEVERQVRLKPYQALATGAGIDEKGYYLAIALLNPSEELARENATLLEQRINQSKIAMAWHSQSGDKWSDLIESMEIESKGRLTLARLYGAVVECWVNFNVMGIMGPYEPLLIHE